MRRGALPNSSPAWQRQGKWVADDNNVRLFWCIADTASLFEGDNERQLFSPKRA